MSSENLLNSKKNDSLLYSQGWFNSRNPQEEDILQGLFDRIFEDLYTFASVSLNAKIDVLQCMQVKQVNTCHILDFKKYFV